MASILKVDTLTGVTTAGSISVTGEGNSTTTNLQQGLAKAWASFDQDSSGHPVYDSLNIASTTDVTTGITKIAFTNAMNNALFSITGACQTQNEDGAIFGTHGVDTSSSRQMTTNDFHTDNRTTSNAGRDVVYSGSSVFGDLA